ncbi:tetratricopeptide repeat protein [Sphingobium chungbukense]|uniref:Uncharacterized protein n=1 Tax=Sphingobium chungbukense TaxID=56193 RepID=A0A0M3AWW7_9SPHN|nr:tetratricopeptide repeat protein [Sphingobium chungbukense]KKW93084.1 hypothetical protein YP76_08450 [Sphingobium chungbukense]
MKKRTLAIALIVATTACSPTKTGVLSVRPVNEEPTGSTKDALARGDLLFAQGDHALALDAFRKAVRYDPDDVHALNGVAISYAAMGRHDLAREFFELALARAPQDARIYRNFARSLEAQGLRGEADALMAAARSLVPGSAGAPKMAARPTLAQLAANGLRTAPANVQRQAHLELERLSLGEVRLRTGASADGFGAAPQFTTRIITVAEVAAPTPARSLSTPIVTVAAEPLNEPKPLNGNRPSAIVAKQPVSLVRASSAGPGVAAACSEVAQAGFRLPATGYAIDLPNARKDGDAAGRCASWAGDEVQDGVFKRLWKAWLQPGNRKAGRG